jgi:hypothetical protein
MANETVVEEFEDFEVDDIVDESEVTEAADASAPSMSMTSNFLEDAPITVDGVEDLGVEEITEDQKAIVRVTDDIGPIYYGNELIEMKKGRRYRVPVHIRKYLEDRDLLWESQ